MACHGGPPGSFDQDGAAVRVHSRREIRRLLDNNASPAATRQWRDLAARKLPELDAHIAETRALRQAVADCLECGCMNFDKCILLNTEADDLSRRGNVS